MISIDFAGLCVPLPSPKCSENFVRELQIKDTELPKEINLDNSENPIIMNEDRPEYRSLAAYMAYTLFCLIQNRKKEIPKILIQWKDLCRTDVLPEVRNVWGPE